MGVFCLGLLQVTHDGITVEALYRDAIRKSARGGVHVRGGPSAGMRMAQALTIADGAAGDATTKVGGRRSFSPQCLRGLPCLGIEQFASTSVASKPARSHWDCDAAGHPRQNLTRMPMVHL